jgi:hypothetical protein
MTAISRPHQGPIPAVDVRSVISGKNGDNATVVDHVAPRSRGWSERVPGPQTPGFVSTTTVFCGLLLTLTPFLWVGGGPDTWTPAGWNEAITGITLTVLGIARLTQQLPLILASGLGCLVGGWLALAPLLLDYGLDPESTPATIVDVLVGTGVLIITILGHVDARARDALTGIPREAR